ncbi:MAG: hypothetical protein MR902_07565 [Campylobacter sp.]|nr:hypothetical protein [Campylobacter sp.]
MIKTEYKINLNIDGEIFELEVREPNDTEQNELKKRADKNALKLKESESLNDELKLNESIIETNKALIKESGFFDKAKLLLENKELIKRNSAITKELNSSLMSEIFSDLEQIYTLRSNLLIESDKKEALFKLMNEKGIKHEKLWSEISKEIAKEQEKN